MIATSDTDDTAGTGDAELRQIVLEGADLLEEAEQVVAECKQLDDHGADLAHRGHHVSGYFALRNRMAQLRPTDKPTGRAVAQLRTADRRTSADPWLPARLAEQGPRRRILR